MVDLLIKRIDFLTEYIHLMLLLVHCTPLGLFWILATNIPKLAQK